MRGVETSGPDAASVPDRRRPALRWLVLLLIVIALIVIPFLLFEQPLTAWTAAALAGAGERPLPAGGLIVGLLAADAVLPVPSSVLSAFAGGAFGWRVGALVIWIGMTLGCIVSYGLGASAGRGMARRLVGTAELLRARRFFSDVGPAALIITRAVPVMGEAATLVAGAAHMPFGRFMLSTGVANLGIALAYGRIGAAAASANSFLIVFIGLVSIPALSWGAWRLLVRPRAEG